MYLENRRSEGESLFETAIYLAEQNGARREEARYLIEFAELVQAAGEEDKKIGTLIAKGLQIFDSLDDRYGRARAEVAEAQRLFNQHKFERVKSNLEALIPALGQAGYRYVEGQARVLFAQAVLAGKHPNRDKAALHMHKAFAIGNALGASTLTYRAQKMLAEKLSE